jgi:hypothetical protein
MVGPIVPEEKEFVKKNLFGYAFVPYGEIPF